MEMHESDKTALLPEPGSFKDKAESGSRGPGPCPVCGRVDDFRELFGIDDGKRLVLGCGCGHQLLHPQPTEEELDALYSDGYYDCWGIKENFDRVFDIKVKTCERLIRTADRLLEGSKGPCKGLDGPRPPRHLDIGCAFGFMLEAAGRAGYETQGLEISPAADEGISHGYKIEKSTLEEASLPEGHFDLVTAMDVVEHIREPGPWLAECLRILKSGGLLLLVTPDCSSLHARIRGAKWPQYKIEHLHYYTPGTLKRLLSDAGFVEARKRTATKYLTLNHIMEHYKRFQPENFEAKILSLLRPFIPGVMLEYPMLYPSQMVVVGRKK